MGQGERTGREQKQRTEVHFGGRGRGGKGGTESKVGPYLVCVFVFNEKEGEWLSVIESKGWRGGWEGWRGGREGWRGGREGGEGEGRGGEGEGRGGEGEGRGLLVMHTTM